MRIAFFGTSEFAVPTLQELHREHHELLVITKPDNPRPRRGESACSPVKLAAEKLGLEVVQPTDIKTPEFHDRIRDWKPLAIFAAAYGKILPSSLLLIPYLGSYNLHASLLPKYRGPAPIQWAIVNGEEETGVSFMKMEAGIDTGPIWNRRTLRIDSDDTYSTVLAELAVLGSHLARQAFQYLIEDNLKMVPQRHDWATLAPMLKKEDGLADFTKSAHWNYNRLRAFEKWPGFYTHHNGVKVDIIEALPVAASRDTHYDGWETWKMEPGTMVVGEGDCISVACGEQTMLQIFQVHPAGGRQMSADDFVNGRRLKTGQKFGV